MAWDIKIHGRKSIVIHDEDRSISLLKPISGEHDNKYIFIYEDAYGDYDFDMLPKDKISLKYKIPVQKLDEALNQLI